MTMYCLIKSQKMVINFNQSELYQIYVRSLILNSIIETTKNLSNQDSKIKLYAGSFSNLYNKK